MLRRILLGAAMGIALAVPAIAQGLPDRPITLISGFAPGGSTDITARLLAERMQAHMGGNARVVVETGPVLPALSPLNGSAASLPMVRCSC